MAPAARTPGARPGRAVGWRSWGAAMGEALYGPGGFYRREAPAAHFRTSVHASPLFAGALARLARSAGLRAVVDLGAGRGELLARLRELDPGLRLHGVDLAGRPDRLPAEVGWSDRLPDLDAVLLVANEWLDTVPLDVVTRAGGRARLVLVDGWGAERAGPAPCRADAAWLARWWPAGDRAEVGRSRDEAWAGVVRRCRRGLLVAVDYAHEVADRPAGGTLTGFRRGRQVRPVPDGSGDLTAHVAVDSVAAAGRAAGATDTVVLPQRDALRRLGVAADRPPAALARRDPAAYLRALTEAGQAAELTDPHGLGAFRWLVQSVGMPVPPPLTRPAPRFSREITGHAAPESDVFT